MSCTNPKRREGFAPDKTLTLSAPRPTSFPHKKKKRRDNGKERRHETRGLQRSSRAYGLHGYGITAFSRTTTISGKWLVVSCSGWSGCFTSALFSALFCFDFCCCSVTYPPSSSRNPGLQELAQVHTHPSQALTRHQDAMCIYNADKRRGDCHGDRGSLDRIDGTNTVRLDNRESNFVNTNSVFSQSHLSQFQSICHVAYPPSIHSSLCSRIDYTQQSRRPSNATAFNFSQLHSEPLPYPRNTQLTQCARAHGGMRPATPRAKDRSHSWSTS